MGGTIKEVTAYKSSDGKLHGTRYEALKHQDMIDFNQQLEAYVNDNFYSSMGVDEIKTTIMGTAEYLHSILSLIMPKDEDYND
jgi:hypothetical protein